MHMKPIVLGLLICVAPEVVPAQSFSCSFGKSPACLDYGDTVCSQFGKCVDDDAVCFDRYQCDYEGFTCQSNLNDCADEYENLLTKHNDLVDEFNDLLEKSQELTEDFEDLEGVLADVRDCVLDAQEADEAQLCVTR